MQSYKPIDTFVDKGKTLSLTICPKILEKRKK